MRKLFQKEKYKRYCLRKATKILRRRQRRGLTHGSKSRIRRRKASNTDLKTSHIIKPKIRTNSPMNAKEVVPPNNFSIINNVEEMLGFFATIIELTRCKHKIILDISGIQQMTSDALVYMLSLFEYCQEKYGFLNISGNFPKEETCHNLLIESGFFKYVKSSIPRKSSSGNILAIESESTVQSKIAQKVVMFTRNHLKQNKSIKSRRTYEILIECMSNTIDHAYKQNSLVPKWYLIALNKPGTGKVSFTFLDGGQGIPSTINIKHQERVKQLISKFVYTVPSIKDNALIYSALKGEFRTRTNEGYRGKGLPKIYQCVENKEIDNLVIISNRGYINCSTDEQRGLFSTFHGTLFSWDFM